MRYNLNQVQVHISNVRLLESDTMEQWHVEIHPLVYKSNGRKLLQIECFMILY